MTADWIKADLIIRLRKSQVTVKAGRTSVKQNQALPLHDVYHKYDKEHWNTVLVED